MLHRLSLTAAVAAATGTAWVVQLTPLSAKTDLISIYRETVDNNVDLTAAQASHLAHKEVVLQARAGLLPQLGAGTRVEDTRIAFDERPAAVKRNSQVVQATLSQPLFRADRWFQWQTAKETDDQARLEFSATQQDLILRSAETYFTMLRAQDNLITNRAEEAAFKRQLSQVNERFGVDLFDKTDMLEAQTSYDTTRANRLIAEQRVSDAFQALVTLTNRDYSAIEGMHRTLPVVPPAPNDAKTWVDTAVQQNLRLPASNYAVSAAEEALRQRRTGHLPTLDAVAQYQRGDNDTLGFIDGAASPLVHYGKCVDERSIGLELNIPIYNGGLTSSQVRESYQRLNQSEQSREGQRRQVVQGTRNLHRTVNTDVEQVQARRQAIISNQNSLEATEIGYQADTRNIVDVLNAQRQLHAAVRDYNNSCYGYILDTLRLKQAADTLSPADLGALNVYLEQDHDPDKDFLPSNLAKITAEQLQGKPRQQH